MPCVHTINQYTEIHVMPNVCIVGFYYYKNFYIVAYWSIFHDAIANSE